MSPCRATGTARKPCGCRDRTRGIPKRLAVFSGTASLKRDFSQFDKAAQCFKVQVPASWANKKLEHVPMTSVFGVALLRYYCCGPLKQRFSIHARDRSHRNGARPSQPQKLSCLGYYGGRWYDAECSVWRIARTGVLNPKRSFRSGSPQDCFAR